MVPWIVANPGRPTSEVAERFGVSEADLIKDLDVVVMVGLPPYTPDTLIEVVYDDGKVWIEYADFFSRPLQLSPAQALAVLASSDGLVSIPGTDHDGPLARALAKLGEALGVGPDDAIDVDLGAAEATVLQQLRQCADGGLEIEIDYYSYNRDERTTRVISPWRVSASEGSWYVESWCDLADAPRTFRVDRIEAARPTGNLSEHRPDGTETGAAGFHPRPDDPHVVLDLTARARWVAETYPCEVLERNDDGSTRVRLAITALPWLERLLVRLGPDVEVVDADALPEARDLAAESARRILTRYQS